MITVRHSRIEDAAQAAAVMRRSIRTLCTADHRDDPATLEAWLANKTVSQVADWLANPDNYCASAVSNGEQVVGFGLVNRHGEILLLYVDPSVTGQGVGARLLAALERQARAWGLAMLTLDSTVTAKSFYERHGFAAACGRRARADGLQCHAMEKSLEP